jgi:hypothetical protein
MTTQRIGDHVKFAHWSATTALRGRATEAAPEFELKDSQLAQADYFRAELCRQLEALDDKAVGLQVRLSHHLALDQSGRVRDVERELRSSVVERRQIIDMINALDHRFERPGEHAHAPRSDGAFGDGSVATRISANLQVVPRLG